MTSTLGATASGAIDVTRELFSGPGSRGARPDASMLLEEALEAARRSGRRLHADHLPLLGGQLDDERRAMQVQVTTANAGSWLPDFQPAWIRDPAAGTHDSERS
jgi:hypothetical protein